MTSLIIFRNPTAMQLKDQFLFFHVQKYGKIDVVVCNAAANPSVSLILDTQESILDKLWEVNVKASILLLKVRFMKF